MSSVKSIHQNSLSSTHSPSLIEFQRAFGQYLRQQNDNKDKDDNIKENKKLKSQNHHVQNDCVTDTSNCSIPPKRIGQLYQSLIFNNISGFLNRCFPVCQSLLSTDKWQSLCQTFVSQHHCHSPYFNEINQSFVEFLSQPKRLQQLDLPPYFAELAHYEWIELLVDTYADDELINTNHQQTVMKLMVNPSLQNLHYQWAVHQISTEYQPDTPEDSFFLVFRHQNDSVQFMQINALTYALIDFINEKSTQPSGILITDDLKEMFKNLILDFSYKHQIDNTDVLIEFGVPLLEQFIHQDVLRTIKA